MTFLISTLLVTIRLVAMIMVAPILGNRSVPIYMRVVLSVVIAIAVTPLILDGGSGNKIPAEVGECIGFIANEAMIGSVIGFGVLIIFSAAVMIGTVVSQMAGLQLDALNSNIEFGQQPASQLIGLAAAATFVMAGGLELLFSSVLDSFQAVPLGNYIGTKPVIVILMTLLQQSFELTIRAVAPAIATLLISTFVIGFLSRTLPQLNLIQVGLSSNFGLMMLALFLTLGGCVWLVIDEAERTATFINDTLLSLR